MTDLVIRELPSTVIALIEARFEEEQYDKAISLLTSHLTAEATSSVYYVPPPNHSAVLVTVLVHPKTINTPLRGQASHFLSRVLDVATPRQAKFHDTWKVVESKQKRGSEHSDESDSNLCELETESLLAQSPNNFWDVLEWAFYKAEGGWEDFLALLVRMLRIDFDEAKEKCKYEIKTFKLRGKEAEEREILTEDSVAALKDTMLYKFMLITGRHPFYARIIRAAFATSGGECMLDAARPIFDDGSTEKRPSTTGDIWNGPILLIQRIELLTMGYELARLYPECMTEEQFLEALLARLCRADHQAVSIFLTNVASRSFRIVLCEQILQRLLTFDSWKTLSQLEEDDFVSRLANVYITSLPADGKGAADELALYCRVLGLLIRSWMVRIPDIERESFRGIVSEVEDVLKRRQERLDKMKEAERVKVANTINLEGQILRQLAIKLEVTA